MRVGIIGLGYFSQFHISAWLGVDGFSISGATDLDPDRRAWAAGLSVPVFDTADQVLETDPQIVDIIAPPPAHAGLIRQALAPGRIIICQKPFCLNFDEAREITAEATAAGTTLAIHENFRFQPWHRTIHAFLATGRMGAIWQARFALRPGDGRGTHAYASRQPRFRTMPRLLIEETAVHHIDLFRWLFGPITGVYAQIERLNPVIAGEDSGLLVLNHDTGTRSTFDGNRLTDLVTDNPRRTMGEMDIVGEGGTLTLAPSGNVSFRPFGSDTWEDIPLVAPVDDTVFGGGCAEALIRHVAANAKTPEHIENQAQAYLPVIAATEAAYRSAASGRREIPEPLSV